MLTVACVLKGGGIYTPDWVFRLRNMVARNLSVEHDFVCLTDYLPDLLPGVKTAGLAHPVTLTGWWAKIELFRPGLFHGRVLYFDLDTVITGDLEPLATQAGKFIGIRDWGHPGKINSSVMAWDARACHGIYQDLKVRTLDEMRGDQDWITAWVGPCAVTWPSEMVVSYKRHCTGGVRYPVDARVVCFHGRPKMNEVKDEWVRTLWI